MIYEPVTGESGEHEATMPKWPRNCAECVRVAHDPDRTGQPLFEGKEPYAVPK